MLVTTTVIAAIAAIAAGLALGLLILLFPRLRQVGAPAQQAACEKATQAAAERHHEVKRLVEGLEKDLHRNAVRLASIDESLDTLRRTLDRQLKEPPPAPPQPAPAPLVHAAADREQAWPARSDPPSTPAAVRSSPAEYSYAERAEPAERPATPPPTAAPPPPAAHLQDLLDQYRDLIARPQRQEINRWGEDQGAVSIEALEDGSLRGLARDAGGMLLLLPVDDEHGMVLPGGRMVVDFGTSYANSLSLRPITKQVFEFENDGAGVLRLAAPAWAERDGDGWRLKQPGRISGLAAD